MAFTEYELKRRQYLKTYLDARITGVPTDELERRHKISKSLKVYHSEVRKVRAGRGVEIQEGQYGATVGGYLKNVKLKRYVTVTYTSPKLRRRVRKRFIYYDDKRELAAAIKYRMYDEISSRQGGRLYSTEELVSRGYTETRAESKTDVSGGKLVITSSDTPPADFNAPGIENVVAP